MLSRGSSQGKAGAKLDGPGLLRLAGPATRLPRSGLVQFRLCTRAHNRNNWTFFGSDTGGRTAAVLRSFITSCELVKLDPFAWFRDVLARIAEHPITRLEQLLPHRWASASQ